MSIGDIKMEDEELNLAVAEFLATVCDTNEHSITEKFNRVKKRFNHNAEEIREYIRKEKQND